MQYYPSQLPDVQLLSWLQGELRRIAEAMEGKVAALRLSTTTVAPERPQEGEVRQADGLQWDPGRGAGLYVYREGKWQLIEAGFTNNVRSLEFFLGD